VCREGLGFENRNRNINCALHAASPRTLIGGGIVYRHVIFDQKRIQTVQFQPSFLVTDVPFAATGKNDERMNNEKNGGGAVT
jgi:hypothetical protein